MNNEQGEDKTIKVNDTIVQEREKLIKFIKNCNLLLIFPYNYSRY